VSLPLINGLVDVVLLDGAVFPSRVEDAAGRVLVVATPMGIHSADVPKLGSSLELAWIADRRRKAVDVKLSALTKEQPPRWRLEALGPVRLQSRRNYVRGGGGETVELDTGSATVLGRVVDMSEGGLRCRVRENQVRREEVVSVRVRLGGDVLELTGTVLFVRPDDEGDFIDLVVTYETTEAIGRAIRGYVLRREMEERRRVYGSNL
jgi:PilZ domain